MLKWLTLKTSDLDLYVNAPVTAFLYLFVNPCDFIRHLLISRLSIHTDLINMTVPRQSFYYCCVVIVFVILSCLILAALIICCERVDPLALLCLTFSCVLSFFVNGVLGQLLYLIVSIPDLCPLPYFNLKLQ